jgi:hypothetical protein
VVAPNTNANVNKATTMIFLKLRDALGILIAALGGAAVGLERE